MRGLIGLLTLLATAGAWAERPTLLTQEDFKYGTYVISEPGRYVLVEDVSFNPNSVGVLNAHCGRPGFVAASGLECPIDAYQAGRPLRSQYRRAESIHGAPDSPITPHYDPSAFGLGFFAAIVVAADDVVIDLNGHTLEQSAEHALLQRFFALIELADRPFVPRQGPADFGPQITSAKRVRIKNGTLGRSAHHGIHGNGNRDVVVRNVRFDGFEVAAIALNGVEGLTVANVRARNREDVPVLGTFSAARFISPYIDFLSQQHADASLGDRSVHEVRADLVRSINTVYDDVILGGGEIDPSAHPMEAALYGNPHRVVDGNAYGFLVNPLGVAVNGFPTRPEAFAKDIVFRNVRIERQIGFINEIIALSDEGRAVTDPIGAIVQLHNRDLWGRPLTMDEQGGYRGNPLSDAQILVGKAIAEGRFANSPLDISRGHLPAQVIRWAEGAADLAGLAWLCNGDSMFHVNKGVIGFKIDGAQNVRMRDVSIGELVNRGQAGSDICGPYAVSHPAATLEGYGGAVTRGVSVAGSADVRIRGLSLSNVVAAAGSAIGVDVLTDSTRVTVQDMRIGAARAGLDGHTSYAVPNEDPGAYALRAGEGTSAVRAMRVCAHQLLGYGDERLIAGDVKVKQACERPGRRHKRNRFDD